MDYRLMVYDIMYALAARSGREEVLFGDCAPLAHEAFARSLAGTEFPEVWFELPLAGEPWFDLHVLTARETLEPGMMFEEGLGGGHPDLFEWFAGADDVRQLALSYDVSRGDIANPAVQLLVWRDGPHGEFLERAGGADVAATFRAFEARLPRGWFACYTGTFPGRTQSAFKARVECVLSSGAQRSYAADAAQMEADLRQVGLTALGDTLIDRCHLLARTPFKLEFQFDLLDDGVVGDAFSASVRFDAPPGSEEWAAFSTEGPALELMEHVESWGLSDDRWRLLPQTAFCKRISGNGRECTAYGFPAFVKLRWRAGEPLDAKAYLIAGVQ